MRLVIQRVSSASVTVENDLTGKIGQAPQIISDSEDYEGCSGAPILDSQCRIVALACAVHTGTRIIYGFPIQKCKELLDYALQTGML